MNTPYGGKLVQRILNGEEKKEAIALAKRLPHIFISEEEVKEVKNIARGLLSPISGFLDYEDLENVATSLKLKNGLVFPIPIYFTVTKEKAKEIKIGKKVTLTDIDGKTVAILQVSDKYTYDKKKFAKNVFKTESLDHPGVRNLYEEKDIFIGGKIYLLDDSQEPFNRFNLDPQETRLLFAHKGWKTIAGFQTRNPIHRGHEYLQRCTLEFVDGLFINPVIGEKKKGDFSDEVVIKSYEFLVNNIYPKSKVVMSILPYRMRYGGPREAILHAIIRKNFGCTHFIVGRDHAGVGNFYGPYEAQSIFDEIGSLGIKIIKMNDAFYCKICRCMATDRTCRHNDIDRERFSGTQIRSLIQAKKALPEELVRREISKIL